MCVSIYVYPCVYIHILYTRVIHTCIYKDMCISILISLYRYMMYKSPQLYRHSQREKEQTRNLAIFTIHLQ